jgi:hypothetical protein
VTVSGRTSGMTRYTVRLRCVEHSHWPRHAFDWPTERTKLVQVANGSANQLTRVTWVMMDGQRRN